ncbi:hypothetical protein MTR_1g064670 [Medicago truncatula]|uniref:Uncharacterized protein n=1 Tax=Medicago truncatula TaxID=3880 RepID=A0A072VLE1_MEDTR|nr:hypothetical protein MTR_1g064670 [Medicago truncatula]
MSKNPYRDFGFGFGGWLREGKEILSKKSAETKNSGDKSKTVVNFKNSWAQTG